MADDGNILSFIMNYKWVDKIAIAGMAGNPEKYQSQISMPRNYFGVGPDSVCERKKRPVLVPDGPVTETNYVARRCEKVSFVVRF
jgi:hypothetical protein